MAAVWIWTMMLLIISQWGFLCKRLRDYWIQDIILKTFQPTQTVSTLALASTGKNLGLGIVIPANKSHLREMSLLLITAVWNKEFCICVVSDGRVLANNFQSNYDDVFILSTAEIYPKVYHTCFFIVTYFAPLCLMVLAYIQICHKLWFQQVCIRVRHQLLQTHFFNQWSEYLLASFSAWYMHIFNQQIPGNTSVMQRKWRSMQCSAQNQGLGEAVRVRTSTVCAEIKQMRARRKTARMLMVVLFVFALCYLPISVLNVMKR